uniref:Uncharacterized protein n=1 Tax=Myoviridae sp. ctp7F23 TaxID=2825174 RepID=A0A8S5U8L4_9CAUD|nr:MAG TPA: hypothetical protein [Myoviridae sp. ctp7F23]
MLKKLLICLRGRNTWKKNIKESGTCRRIRVITGSRHMGIQ